MWSIGGIRVDGTAVLGPMSGFTFESYREFMKPFGVAVCFSEMTSAVGIVNDDRHTSAYVGFRKNYPTGVQLFGHDAEDLAKAASMALHTNPNIDFFDVNMGCPVYKIQRSGAGAVLMKDPAKCGEIIRRMKGEVDVPITAKIRLGWDSDHMNYREVIGELESAGVDAVTVHARTKSEQYSGTPHYSEISGLQDDMSVPLIVSGNIYSVDDAIAAVETTSAKGVMVARGGVGNPFLVTQIDRYFRTGEKLENPTVHQQVGWCIRLAEMIIEEKGEDAGIRKLRSVAPKFIAGCHRSRDYRLRLATQTVSMESMTAILDELDRKMGMERINSDGRRTYYPLEAGSEEQ